MSPYSPVRLSVLTLVGVLAGCNGSEQEVTPRLFNNGETCEWIEQIHRQAGEPCTGDGHCIVVRCIQGMAVGGGVGPETCAIVEGNSSIDHALVTPESVDQFRDGFCLEYGNAWIEFEIGPEDCDPETYPYPDLIVDCFEESYY